MTAPDDPVVGVDASQPGALFLHPVGLDGGCVDWIDVPGLRGWTFPGHGDRPRATTPPTLEEWADEVAASIRDPMHIVGASLGGMVALHLALIHPEKVSSLVLSCTTPQGDPQLMRDRADRTETLGAVQMVEETFARWFTSEYLDRTPLDPPLLYARHRLQEMDTGALADTWRAIAQHDVHDRLAEIEVPTTCIAGLRDISTPLEVMTALAHHIPGARLIELDAPHMAHLERPRQYADAVREHVAWACARRAPGAE